MFIDSRFPLIFCITVLSAFSAYAAAPKLTPPAPSTVLGGKDGAAGKSGALNEYDPKYRPHLPPAPMAQPDLPTGSVFWVALSKGPEAIPGHAEIKIFQPMAISGCMSIDMPPPAVRANGDQMWVDVKKPRAVVDPAMLHGHGCRGNNGVASASIPLDAQTIKTVAFKSEQGMDYYNVINDESHIALTPRSEVFFKPAESAGDDGLSVRFYSGNTVILSVPRAGRDQDFSGEIRALAVKNGLTDEGDFATGAQKNTLYFTDKTGKLVARLRKGDAAPFGTVTRMQTYYGPQGAYEKPENLDILARLPGQVD